MAGTPNMVKRLAALRLAQELIESEWVFSSAARFLRPLVPKRICATALKLHRLIAPLQTDMRLIIYLTVKTPICRYGFFGFGGGLGALKAPIRLKLPS